MTDALDSRIAPDIGSDAPEGGASRRYRSIWISDIHLGTRGCKARILLDFLKHTESEHLYLTGDIVDGQQMARSWFWAQSHNDVVQKLLRKARKGTHVVYIPGNHDHIVRGYAGLNFGGIRIEKEVLHRTADGRVLWVFHGDEFDPMVQRYRVVSMLGDIAYEIALGANVYFNRLRRLFGKPYWSLSAHLKGRVKTIVNILCSARDKAIEAARHRKVDGIVCGHTHRAEITEIDGILYCNDGDWVESCTALVEHLDGRLEVLDWVQVREFCMFETYA